MDLHFEYSESCRQYDVFEVMICVGEEFGNPFLNKIRGVFRSEQEQKEAEGFYDGDGIYRVRFMPSFEGKYTFHIEGDILTQEVAGAFMVTEAAEDNHGILHVENQFHFMLQDGTRFYPIGTTCYVWNLQSEELQKETLNTLAGSPFNKIRFCVFPKHYDYNLTDPEFFPYEGTPVDASRINHHNFTEYGVSFPGRACIDPSDENHWDFHRFVPQYFRNLENNIAALGKLGIEADLILFHPYDRWGFSCMSAEEDEFYLHYVTARLSAFHNLWWSMANEYDLMQHKTVADWDRLGTLVTKLDPYGHLISIHNCMTHYDFRKPWVSHCSIQRINLYLSAELTEEWRHQYGKPVVLDEICYEGNIQHGWGNISGQELTRRFWECVLRGGYPVHGETVLDHVPTDAPEDHQIKLWWSHGGKLKGESPARIAFLLKVLQEIPGNNSLKTFSGGLWDEVAACCDDPAQDAMKARDYYLFYYSFMNPMFRNYYFDDETEYEVEVLDTWEMTVKKLGRKKGRFTVELPAKPYMAVRMVKAANGNRAK